MDDAALKTEIETDPANMGYAPYVAAGDLVSVANLLNDRRFPGRQKITVGDVLTVARERGLTPRIRQYSGIITHLPPPDGTTPGQQLAALAAVDLFTTVDRPLDLDLPAVVATLDGLEQAGLLDSLSPVDGTTVLHTAEENRAAITALADTKYSRADLVLGAADGSGRAAPSHSDVARALKGGAE